MIAFRKPKNIMSLWGINDLVKIPIVSEIKNKILVKTGGNILKASEILPSNNRKKARWKPQPKQSNPVSFLKRQGSMKDSKSIN